MLRKACVLGVCLAMLATGCRKKEKEPPKPEGGGTPQVVAPAGFARVPGSEGTVFISRQPANVGDYLAYLSAVGLPVPERLGAIDVARNRPVTGITLEEARRFAAWKLARLPDAAEWQAAAQIVGGGVYPWGEGLPAGEVRPDARVFLVRNWIDGSPQEQQALSARQQVMDDALAQHREAVAELTGELEEALAKGADAAREQWTAAKPKVFIAIGKQKELAELSAARTRRNDVLAILGLLGRKKADLIRLKLADDAQPGALEEAIKAYGTELATHRNQAQEAAAGVMQANKEASQQVVQMTQKVEQAAAALAAGISASIGVEAVPELPPGSIEQAVSQQEGLRETLAAVNVSATSRTEFFTRLTRESVQRALKLDKELATVAEGDDAAQAIEDMEKRIKALNEDLEAQFEQEPHLFADLRKLTEVSARKTGLEAEMAELRALLTALDLVGAGGAAGGPEGR